MNHIEQAYQQGVLIRCKGWGDDEWIKKHSETESIAENGKIYFSFIIINIKKRGRFFNYG